MSSGHLMPARPSGEGQRALFGVVSAHRSVRRRAKAREPKAACIPQGMSQGPFSYVRATKDKAGHEFRDLMLLWRAPAGLWKIWRLRRVARSLQRRRIAGGCSSPHCVFLMWAGARAGTSSGDDAGRISQERDKLSLVLSCSLLCVSALFSMLSFFSLEFFESRRRRQGRREPGGYSD